jgi:hypothetical protein
MAGVAAFAQDAFAQDAFAQDAFAQDAFAQDAFAQDMDPPTRVIRLSAMSGAVSMEPAGIDDWAPAVVNRPFYIGDYLYADNGSRAELHTDIARMRLWSDTNIGILNLTNTGVQVKLTQGDFEVSLHDFNQYQTFEVDTPNSAINFLRAGVYRLHVDPNANTTWLTVRSGQAEVTGGGQAFTVNPGSMASMAGADNQMSYDIESLPPPDAFDEWVAQRDAHFAHRPSAHYLPPTVIGYEDLDDYGGWAATPAYGQIWYPRTVAVGWSPYHYGHWSWVEPWGWTWVDDAPWGFAPFHYGRWVYVNARWGWAPGPMVVVGGYSGPPVRPCYAPAMVAWFGGAHWGVSVSFGGAPSVGWVPLGWGEVYTPPYHVSQNYFSNVNVNNTRVVNNVNITNVYKTVYVNKTVYNQTFVNVHSPNAVVAMPQNALASGRPVSQAATVVPAAQAARIQTAQAAVVAPAVVPTRQALAPTLGSAPAPHPPAQALARPVVARAVPPPLPPSFAARQTYLQQHVGQPLNTAAMHSAVRPATQQIATVKQAPPAKPVPVAPGQHFGVPRAQVAANAGRNPQAPAANTSQAKEVAQPHASPRPATTAEGVPPSAAREEKPPVHPQEKVAPAPQNPATKRPVESEERPASHNAQLPKPNAEQKPQAHEAANEHTATAPHGTPPPHDTSTHTKAKNSEKQKSTESEKPREEK